MKPAISQKDIEKILRGIFFAGVLIFSVIGWVTKSIFELFNKNSENVPQNGVKSKQVKKSATLPTFALKHMGNPYHILRIKKELRF